MASTRMQLCGSNHTYQIAFRVLVNGLYQTIFLLVVGSHRVLSLGPCCFLL